jgi:hypothetical protein
MAFQALIEDPISNSFPGMVTKIHRISGGVFIAE